MAKGLEGGTMGNLNTTSMMKNPLNEAQYAIKLTLTILTFQPTRGCR